MSEADALSNFDFSQVSKPSVYLKWEAGKPLKLRVLTTDPMVYQNSFVDKETQEETFDTKFAFIVYNFTDNKAQILQAGPSIAKKIGQIHVDPDFGSNIKKVDIKITPTGEKLQRRYEIQVLPTAEELTNEQIKEAQKINLEELISKNATMAQRMSFYDPAAFVSQEATQNETPSEVTTKKDVVIEDISDEPVNLDDIPF